MSKIKNPDALIRVGDVIKVLCRNKCYPGPLCPDSYCTEMWDEFEEVKLVDVVPVVHGRWIIHIDDLFPLESTMECNKCHEHQPLICDDNFCPNCGAKMDGKDEDGRRRD